jgi:hypothetical protein
MSNKKQEYDEFIVLSETGEDLNLQDLELHGPQGKQPNSESDSDSEYESDTETGLPTGTCLLDSQLEDAEDAEDTEDTEDTEEPESVWDKAPRTEGPQIYDSDSTSDGTPKPRERANLGPKGPCKDTDGVAFTVQKSRRRSRSRSRLRSTVSETHESPWLTYAALGLGGITLGLLIGLKAKSTSP